MIFIKIKLIAIIIFIFALICSIIGIVHFDKNNNIDIPLTKTGFTTKDGVSFNFSPVTKILTVSGTTLYYKTDYFKNEVGLEYWFEYTEKIVFEEGVKQSECSFEKFKNVKTVEICSSMEKFSIYTLPLLEKFIVNEKCKCYFNDENGVLYKVSYTENNPDKKSIYLAHIPKNANITEFTIPDNVVEVFNGVLQNCNHINKVIIGKDFKGDIKEGILNANNINFFEVHKDNKKYCSDEQGILYNKDKTYIYAIPSTIEELVMPENSRFILAEDDEKNSKIKRITISNIESFFSYGYLGYFSNLEEVIVPGNNSEYCSIDGVVFSKDMSEIIYFPRMKDTETYEIPSSVKTINYSCFRATKKLKNLIIPDSVTMIEDCAFYNAEALETVRIGKGLKTFEIIDAINTRFDFENPFDHTDNLKYIEVNKDNPYYCSDSQGALYTKDMKILMTVPAGRTSKKFTIPDSVETVRYSFTNCADLEVINIGSGVKDFFVYSTIDAFDFYGLEYCESLKEINVSENNPNFKSVNGVMYSKDGEELVLYPASKKGKNFIVPKQVLNIHWKAFRLNKYLENIYIHKNMKEFYSYIDGFLFFACDDNGRMMFNIYYEGDESVNKYNQSNSDDKSGYRIYYNSLGIPK